MTLTAFDQVLTSARRLSRSERARLIASLADDLATLMPPAVLSEAEQTEAIQSAVHDYQTRPETFQPHEEVRNRIQAILAEQAV